jgi:hypothetical protein
MADPYSEGVADGFANAADIVEKMRDSYSTPGARAALGFAMDKLREYAAEVRLRAVNNPETSTVLSQHVWAHHGKAPGDRG